MLLLRGAHCTRATVRWVNAMAVAVLLGAMSALPSQD